MINRNNKKGFTIVELVIVIAVIAILAAVLIPTFSGIIKKANISADTQLAKNLNTALTMSEASGTKIEDFNDVLSALREEGFIVSNLNPTAAGCYFVWESLTNQIILVDGSKEFEIIYSSEELVDKTPGATWWFAVKNQENIDAIKAKFGDSVNIFHTPEDKESLLNAFKSIQSLSGAQSVVISESINLSKPGEIFKLDNASAEVTVDFAGATVNCAGAIDIEDYEVGTADRAFTVKAGKSLVVANGTLNAGDTYGTVAVDSATTVTVDNMTLLNSHDYGLNLKTRVAGAVIEVVGSTINATLGGGGCEAAYGTINLRNTTINQTGLSTSSHISTCVAVSYEGVANIYSGTYTSENAPLAIYSSGGTINIYGGTFNGTDWKSITTEDAWKALLQSGADYNGLTINITDEKVVIYAPAQ